MYFSDQGKMAGILRQNHVNVFERTADCDVLPNQELRPFEICASVAENRSAVLDVCQVYLFACRPTYFNQNILLLLLY